MNKNRVLFISSEFPPGPGGIGNHGFNFIHTLKQKGYEVHILTNLENATAEKANAFARQMDLSVEYIPREGLMPIQWRRIMAGINIMRQHSFDYIICSGMFSLWLGRVLMILFRRPMYIAIIHGSEITLNRAIPQRLTRWSLKRFKTIVSVSQFTRSLIHPKYSWQRHEVIPNAVDIAFLSTFEQRPIQKLKGHPAILTVGNVTRRKGQHNIIKALPDIIKVYPETHYHCIGLPSLMEENIQLAKSLGVESYITFHQKQPVEVLMDAYRGCDIFMMLSENQPDGDIEGFGIAILEANYFGKPAIGSIGCGIEDAIDNGYNGYKVNNHDALAVAHAVTQIMCNPGQWTKPTRKWALQHNWNDVAEKYIALM